MIARSKKRVPLYLSAVDLFVKPLLVVCFELVCQLHLLKQIISHLSASHYPVADLAQHGVDAVVDRLEVPKHFPAPRHAPGSHLVVAPVVESMREQ